MTGPGRRAPDAAARRRAGVAVRSVLAAWAVAGAVALGARDAPAQVFLATHPAPEFAIGPLFVRASVGPALGPVTVDVLWSLVVPATRSALGLEQDLYLVWPAEVGAERGGPRDAELVEYIRSRGFEVTGAGALPLLVQDLYASGGRRASEREVGTAPFVTFGRAAMTRIGTQPAATLVRIPWTPDLVNPIRLVKLRLRLDGAIRPTPASWFEEAIRGRRQRVSLTFNDVRSQSVFPLYHENRERLVPLASEPSQILIRFADAERLRIDEVFPSAATRETRGGTPPSEVVSLFLDTASGAAPQALTVQFGYASGLQAWAPILIPLAFFVLGRATGPLIERLARSFGRSLSGRLRLGSASSAPDRKEGALVSRETLAQIVPGRTTGAQVLDLCGRDGLEEQERLGAPEERTLVYRGRRIVPKRHRRLAWFVAAVSDWELEEQTVEILVGRGIVQDVQVRVRRAHLAYPDGA